MSRLESQIAFLVEIDKLKNVVRRSLLTDGSRRENSAEHSWHLALFAMLLQEYAPAQFSLANTFMAAAVTPVLVAAASMAEERACRSWY